MEQSVLSDPEEKFKPVLLLKEEAEAFFPQNVWSKFVPKLRFRRRSIGKDLPFLQNAHFHSHRASFRTTLQLSGKTWLARQSRAYGTEIAPWFN